jgi:hypothetical protein
MQSETIENQIVQGEWQAEVVNHEGDGEVYVTIFSGPDAEERAKEFCLHRNGSDLQSSLSEFFANRSIEDLAKVQGIGPIKDIRVLSGGIPEDEDIDAFLQEIYGTRK